MKTQDFRSLPLPLDRESYTTFRTWALLYLGASEDQEEAEAPLVNPDYDRCTPQKATFKISDI